MEKTRGEIYLEEFEQGIPYEKIYIKMANDILDNKEVAINHTKLLVLLRDWHMSLDKEINFLHGVARFNIILYVINIACIIIILSKIS